MAVTPLWLDTWLKAFFSNGFHDREERTPGPELAGPVSGNGRRTTTETKTTTLLSGESSCCLYIFCRWFRRRLFRQGHRDALPAIVGQGRRAIHPRGVSRQSEQLRQHRGERCDRRRSVNLLLAPLPFAAGDLRLHDLGEGPLGLQDDAARNRDVRLDKVLRVVLEVGLRPFPVFFCFPRAPDERSNAQKAHRAPNSNKNTQRSVFPRAHDGRARTRTENT